MRNSRRGARTGLLETGFRIEEPLPS
jgi:hypothetical protein